MKDPKRHFEFEGAAFEAIHRIDDYCIGCCFDVSPSTCACPTNKVYCGANENHKFSVIFIPANNKARAWIVATKLTGSSK
jgi:hypothetical protein